MSLPHLKTRAPIPNTPDLTPKRTGNRIRTRPIIPRYDERMKIHIPMRVRRGVILHRPVRVLAIAFRDHSRLFCTRIISEESGIFVPDSAISTGIKTALAQHKVYARETDPPRV